MDYIISRNEVIQRWLEEHHNLIQEMADYIFRNPELSLQEEKSSRCLADFLEKNGFSITWGISGFETAFLAEWGSGKPVLGFLAEYDALPGLGQELCCEETPTGGPGHGCGHNLLGTACAAAACSLKAWMETGQIKGTIRVYGCPAEETVIGKIKMNEDGVFDFTEIGRAHV